ncbi:MAG: serine hydrolase [Vicinamibacteria bacterium]
MTRRTLLLPAVVLTFITGASLFAQTKARPAFEDAIFDKLKSSLAVVDAGLDGVMGVAVKDLTTGRMIEIRGDVVFPQASSIKLALVYELYQKANAGKIDLGALRVLPKARVGGSGVLPFLSEKAQLTGRDLAILMMSLSDNAATNILVDEVTFASVNARMDQLGLLKTRFRRHMIDLAAARRGEENVSTPNEMVRLIEVIQKAEGLIPSMADDLHAVVSVPKQNAFRAVLPDTLTIYDKSGELEGVRTSTGLVVLKSRPYAVAVMTTALQKEIDGDNAIKEVSRLVYETFERLDRASPEGRLLGRD